MPDRTLPLLNVFEVEIDGMIRHLICFLDPVRAGSVGIDRRAVVGEFTPRPDGAFDPGSFRLNPHFIATLTEYMNESAAHAPELIHAAGVRPGGRVEVLDPRHPADDDPEPPASETLGHFAVDDSGRIVPGSFEYNARHTWFDPDSALFSSRSFYDWLHP